MLVLLGLCLMETFITISTLLAFYKIHNLYQAKGGLNLDDIIRLYLKRYLRFAPAVFLVFFFGVYVMPWAHGGLQDTANDPIWYSFEEILFFRCQEPAIRRSKLLFYSNLWPSFQDDKNDCMAWSWTYECDC